MLLNTLHFIALWDTFGRCCSKTKSRLSCISCRYNYSLTFTSRFTDVPYRPILRKPILGECNSLNVSWSPPTRQALGGPITYYAAQIRKDGPGITWINCTSFNISNSTQSCLFTHLKKNTKYNVRVLAKNKVGYGFPSEILTVLTEGSGTWST